jgi:transposase
MNGKLTEAVADVTGKTGMGIIRAILAGARDPKELAALRDRRCKQDEGQLARALTGTWQAEHLFELAQAVAQYNFTCAQISQTDAALEAELQRLQLAEVGELPAPRAGKRKLRRKKGNALDSAVPTEERHQSLFGCSGVDLTQIEGVGEETALVVLAEVGPDLSRFPTSKQFCAWLGLCRQVQKSGGKVLSSGCGRAAIARRRRCGWRRTRCGRARAAWARSSGGCSRVAGRRRR